LELEKEVEVRRRRGGGDENGRMMMRG